MIRGWLRPMRREFWRLVPHWRHALSFMSNQSNLIGASVVGFMIYAEIAPRWIALALVAWVVLAAIGSVIEQPEVRDVEAE